MLHAKPPSWENYVLSRMVRIWFLKTSLIKTSLITSGFLIKFECHQNPPQVCAIVCVNIHV